MARDREKFVERTGGQPSTGKLPRVASAKTSLAKTPTASHPALMTLVKLLARQATHGLDQKK